MAPALLTIILLLFKVDEELVPPWAIGITVVPVIVPLITGVVSVGDVPNTATPVPVLSDKAPDKFAEVNEPNEAVFPTDVTAPVKFALVVTLPAVKPDAVPVKFVATPADGVPMFGVTNTGEVFITNVVPVPV